MKVGKFKAEFLYFPTLKTLRIITTQPISEDPLI